MLYGVPLAYLQWNGQETPDLWKMIHCQSEGRIKYLMKRGWNFISLQFTVFPLIFLSRISKWKSCVSLVTQKYHFLKAKYQKVVNGGGQGVKSYQVQIAACQTSPFIQAVGNVRSDFELDCNSRCRSVKRSNKLTDFIGDKLLIKWS